MVERYNTANHSTICICFFAGTQLLSCGVEEDTNGQQAHTVATLPPDIETPTTDVEVLPHAMAHRTLRTPAFAPRPAPPEPDGCAPPF